eukprot:CAMPEP_0170518614 /NCGR_PEP_ID=MMETSP0209-20121228/4272_1 /TAXON_ID=665100 ORGANISM="Litonotus pictus, Strain P1" /NCGR_SAMPLE_ID=MMETSP0209 /ASSEMBLY_ACC=CAM_ASM_000301 /LENGTH=180 /DNA_ID=CAMNT_0010804245 /DNA_START=66 /DNA_END=608 /DNA_ORIENTATION=-
MTYLAYYPIETEVDQRNYDYHEIEIAYHGTTAVPSRASDSESNTFSGSWLTSLHRNNGDSTESTVNKDATDYSYLHPFFIGMDGIRTNFNYLAWDFSYNCQITTDILRVKFKIKYFSCYTKGRSFYDTVTSDRKAYVKEDGNVIVATQPDNDYLTTNYPNNVADLLQPNAVLIGLCDAQT